LAQDHLDKVVKRMMTEYYIQVVVEKVVANDKKNEIYYMEESAVYFVIRRQ